MKKLTIVTIILYILYILFFPFLVIMEAAGITGKRR